jgi:hypothetical protein
MCFAKIISKMNFKVNGVKQCKIEESELGKYVYCGSKSYVSSLHLCKGLINIMKYVIF